jgi:hypothetical protein
MPLREIPGFWSVPVCFVGERWNSTLNVHRPAKMLRDCRNVDKGGFGCCSAKIDLSRRHDINQPACTNRLTCPAWEGHFTEDNLGMDAWCAKQLGQNPDVGYYYHVEAPGLGHHAQPWDKQCPKPGPPPGGW